MSDQMTFADTPNVTGSQELVAGPMPYASPDGPMTDLFGQALAPASRSAPPASSVAATMSATYGLRSSTSSASAALESLLASRLPALLDTHGQTMWVQMWKAKATPLRRRILAHTASAPRTFDKGSTGSPWPTPMAGTPAQNGNNAAGNNDSSRKTVELAATWPTPRREDSESTGAHHGKPDTLHSATQLAGWPTPNTPSGGRSMSTDKMDATGRTADGRKHTASLEHAVKFAGWPTATVQDAASSGSAAYSTDSGRHSGTTLTDAARMAWATPQAMDHKGAMNPGNDLTHNARPLNEQVRLTQAAWATPKTSDMKGETYETTENRRAELRKQAHGATLSGSPAAMAKPAQLNARFSGWLMGYPIEWCVAAIEAWHSSAKRQKKG